MYLEPSECVFLVVAILMLFSRRWQANNNPLAGFEGPFRGEKERKEGKGRKRWEKIPRK